MCRAGVSVTLLCRDSICSSMYCLGMKSIKQVHTGGVIPLLHLSSFKYELLVSILMRRQMVNYPHSVVH